MFKLSLTQRYIPAILLLAIFIISSHLVISNVVNSNKELARIINVSGKQRMLSQRLIILGQNYYENSFKRPEFVKDLSDIKIAHDYLLSKVLTSKLNEIYYGKNSLDKNLKRYLKHFDNLLLLNNPMFLKLARDESLIILLQLDSAVREYEKFANDKLEIASNYEFYIMITTLLILLLEVFFIFRPASRKIDKNTKELQRNKEYEETVLESNNNAIIAIDWTGKITTYNQKAVELFGWSKEEMLGKRNLLKIIPPKYKELHKNASSNYLNTGISCGVLGNTHELQGIHKDNTIFDIRISFGAKYKTKGAIVVANISDITTEIEQNNLMIQQSKMASMGEMMENIAHQWRQPLSSISTATSGLQFEKEYGMLKDDILNKRLESIMKNTKFLSKTIEDFSNFFKKSKVKDNFLISNVLLKTQNIINDTLKINKIEIFKNYDKNTIISYFGYEDELSQVIISLLNNAKDILIEKKIENKLIKIELEEEETDIIIKIFDNAGGIPDDILSKIFEPYFTTKHRSQGTGIGLYMSTKIINSHFLGNLKAYNTTFKINEKEYYGACLHITIPIKSD